MYLGTATLRRFEAEGSPPEDLPLVDWSMQYTFAQIQQALSGIYRNLPLPFLSIVGAWSRLNPIGVMPSDKLGSKIARLMQTPGKQRDNLTKDIYIPVNTGEALGRLEQAFILSVQADLILKKIKTASSLGTLPKERPERLVRHALEAGIISLDEVELLTQAESVRDDAIQVDSFTLPEYQMSGAEINARVASLG